MLQLFIIFSAMDYHFCLFKHLEIQTMWQLHSWLHPEGELGIYAAVHKYLRIRLLNSFVEIIRFIYQYQMVCNYINWGFMV